MDDAQDDDPMTDSEPEMVKIVQDRVICIDQAAGDEDQPHAQLGHRVVHEAFQRPGESLQPTRLPGCLIGSAWDNASFRES
jgi:hypothetical protein